MTLAQPPLCLLLPAASSRSHPAGSLPEITGGEQLASKDENTLGGESPRIGREPQEVGRAGEAQRHPSQGTGRDSAPLTQGPSDCFSLCTHIMILKNYALPSTFATRHLSISKASLKSCKEYNFQDNVNIYILK